MLDEWGATCWTYDLLGRPTSRHDPRDTIVYSGYDARGQRTEMTVYGQGTVYYSYRYLCQLDLGARADSALSSISLS